MAESAADHRLKRLAFRSWHRGFREMDLILGPFADIHLKAFDEPTLDLYETLLEVPDWDIFGWICGKVPVPEDWDCDLVRALIDFASAGPEIRGKS